MYWDRCFCIWDRWVLLLLLPPLLQLLRQTVDWAGPSILQQTIWDRLQQTIWHRWEAAALGRHGNSRRLRLLMCHWTMEPNKATGCARDCHAIPRVWGCGWCIPCAGCA